MRVSKPPKRRAYLVSVKRWLTGVRVYAVLAASPDEALKLVALTAPRRAKIAVVGGLSRDFVRRLELAPGELRAI